MMGGNIVEPFVMARQSRMPPSTLEEKQIKHNRLKARAVAQQTTIKENQLSVGQGKKSEIIAIYIHHVFPRAFA